MLVQQVTSGDRDCFVGTVTLSFLKRVMEHSFPFKEHVMPPLEKEEKAIDEIAQLIVDRLTSDQTWWMGGLSFAIYPSPSFQPLSLGQYESENSGKWGMLYLSDTGSEIWVPLDGYQRMLGMLKALSMLSGKKRLALAEDMLPVILLPSPTYADCQEMLLRMHKSARTIDRGEAIRTTVNDDYAMYARWLMGEDKERRGVVPKDLVNWKSNTLTNRLCKFTTLSVLYDSVRMLDQALGHNPVASSPEKAQRYNEIADLWNLLLKGFTHFHEAVYGTPERLPSLRERFLCLKPTGQLIVVAVIALALRLRKELSLEEVVERLNKIPWRIDDPLWRNIVLVEGRVNGTGQAITLTSRLVAYLIGLPLSDAEVQALEQGYRKGKREENISLPGPLFPSWGQ